MLLLPVAEKRGLFLQRSRPGLVFLSSPLFFDFGVFLVVFFSFFLSIGGRCCFPTPSAEEPQSPAVLGLWGSENGS